MKIGSHVLAVALALVLVCCVPRQGPGEQLAVIEGCGARFQRAVLAREGETEAAARAALELYVGGLDRLCLTDLYSRVRDARAASHEVAVAALMATASRFQHEPVLRGNLNSAVLEEAERVRILAALTALERRRPGDR